jgi:hypothetical protein
MVMFLNSFLKFLKFTEKMAKFKVLETKYLFTWLYKLTE